MKIRWTPILLAATLALWIAWRFAQPIGDADVFWHMEYAKQMIARHTLRVDHSIYSWMPASNRMIYCAWLSEFGILALWQWKGVGGLALLRYGGIALTIILMGWFARRQGMLGRPLSWLLMLFASLGSLPSTQPKPELFSVVLWHVLLFCYFGFRSAVRKGADPSRWLWSIPVVMLVWANMHGGFILAAPFFTVALACEWIPEWLAKGRSAATPLRWQMTKAWGCAFLATMCTPYGPRYPFQLLGNYALQWTPRPDTSWNAAYKSAISDAGFYLHLPEFLALMILAWMAMLVITARRGPIDWSIPALNLVYVPLYLLYIRSAFLLPVMFAYSVLWIAREVTPAPSRGRIPVFSVATVLLFLLLLGRSVRENGAHPEMYSWTGFGYSYFLPVEEADFLARINAGPQIYNLFDSGGYLLWRLYPQYQVMTDSRSFPYLSWFGELYHFTRESSFQDFEKFLHDHPANAAIVDLKEQLVWRNFLKAPGWSPVYYGPSAAVFLKTAQKPPIGVARGVRTLRNAEAAFNVFDFAIALADYPTAWAVAGQLNFNLRRQADPVRVEAVRRYREAHAALRAGDFPRAEKLFLASLDRKAIGDRDALVLALLRGLREGSSRKSANVGRIVPALRLLAAPP